jgi:glycosyltransferase involved in cell wall biosynthesis
MTTKHALIDCREFSPGKKTGISRFLEGLIDALAAAYSQLQFRLVSFERDAVPSELKEKENIEVIIVPNDFLRSEKALSDLAKRGAQFFISPYPKLPLFGCQCVALHVVHDVLDLTHPAYRNRFKAYLDSFRLKRALRRANLTWYVSSWSLTETKKHAGYIGRNPKVRHNAIAEKFFPKDGKTSDGILRKYGIKPGYIIAVGNGMPHKNLGIILEIANQFIREVVFVGLSKANQTYWKRRHPSGKAVFLDHVKDEEMPAILRGAFCLAQPSTAEGYGYPPLEAMACGVPAVVSSIPVLIETTGGNALFANPNDPGQWLEAFESLKDESLYKDLVSKGLKWTQPLLGSRGWQKHISDIAELLNFPLNSSPVMDGK